MKKVLAVVTARCSWARIQTALEELHKVVELHVAIPERHSQFYRNFHDSVGQFQVHEMALPPEDGSVGAAVRFRRGVEEAVRLLLVYLKPDMVVMVADRFETLGITTIASQMEVPIAHLQGGERSGCLDDRIRDANSALSDLHFASTKSAASRLKHFVRNPENVYHTGCPSIDLCARVKNDIVEDSYIIVMQHPVTGENYGDQLALTFSAISDLDCFTYWFGSNPDPSNVHRDNTIPEYANIAYIENIPPDEFLKQLKGASCLVGNSSCGIREAGYFGTPVVNIGTRQQGRERAGNVLDVGYDVGQIREAIYSQLGARYPQSHLYGDGNAGARIAEQVRSYLDG